MAGDADLDRLAELLGIAPFYHDIWGNRRDIATATKRDLARSMGFPADDEAQVAESLKRIEERPWRRVMSPVGILDQGGYAATEVMLPEDVDGLSWEIRLEDGGRRTGACPTDRMEMLGERRVDGRLIRRWRVPLPQDLPLGYHRLRISYPGAGEAAGEMSLIVAPRRCFTPEDLAPGERFWGFGIQLYALHGRNDWGVGDFGRLAHFSEIAGRVGADVVGLNPLHAMFPADPNNYGPYSPSNRAFLNVLYIDLHELCRAQARDLIEDLELQRRLEAVRAVPLIDYPAVSHIKMPVLETLFARFRESGTDREAFESWRRGQGTALERQALFDALHEHFYKGQGIWDWHQWPESYRSPDGEGARFFARDHADRITFFAWLQWVADRQLGQAAERARAAGLRIGFYRDLAVGNHPGGAAAWSSPGVVLDGANVGAPPDLFNPKGQNWGLAPFSPIGLLEEAYEPFIASLRANMRHAGAIRIDHAMALRQLYWIPAREDHEGGAYVRYPERDLLRLIALESQRHRCLVIGEALGTVPEGFPEVLAEAGILSYRVFYFEREEDNAFKPPSAYPEDAMVTVTTHDLPTLAGWWTGHDQDWRNRLNLYAEEGAFEKDRVERMEDRGRALTALVQAGLFPSGETVPERVDLELAVAVHRFLAVTPGKIMMVQIEDALGEVEQPNLPGTTTQHPNWQRKLPVWLDELETDGRFLAVVAAVREARPRSGRRE